jgi:peptide/nickel transport system ATP-binding protein
LSARDTADMQTLLEVENLRTYFRTRDGVIKAVDDISFSVDEGSTLGIVGESGCGKSMTALSILQILPPPGKIESGTIRYNSKNGPVDIAKLNTRSREMQNIRGNEIGMIFQDPMTAFCPVYTIGDQIVEALVLHQGVSRKDARVRTIEALGKVGISAPAQRIDEYPHELSGGIRQRAMIAMALSCNPSLLLADEPTTSLDVTISAQIIRLLRDLQMELHMAIIIITHNLGVISEMANHVAVMYMGKVVEFSTLRNVFHAPKHPYTLGLLGSIPLINRGGKVDLVPIQGQIPDKDELIAGCIFSPRCPFRMGKCSELPPVKQLGDNHQVRCWLYD